MTDSAYTDTQLRDWLRSAHEHGSAFLQAVAEAAFLADAQAYRVLRPALLKLRETHAEPRP